MVGRSYADAPAGNAAVWALTSAPHGRASLRAARDRAQVAGRSGSASAPGRCPNDDDGAPRSYVLEMLPYPSGEPHMGHLKNYSVGDAVAHFRRRNGMRVLHPMGYDAFGLPAENNAIKTGEHPREATEKSIASFQRAVPLVGHLDRLVARVRHARAALLPLDPVDLPAAVPPRPGLPQGGGGQLVPEGRHGAGQRAGDRRPLRALRHRGRAAPAGAVVLPHHRLRRPPAGRSGDDRLAAPRGHDAAQLDRPLRGRRGHVLLPRGRASTTRSSPPARTRCSARRSS